MANHLKKIGFQLDDEPNLYMPIGSMGLVYLAKWIVDFYGFHVAKYTGPVPWIRNGMGNSLTLEFQVKHLHFLCWDLMLSGSY